MGLDCCHTIEYCLCDTCKLHKLYMLLDIHEREDYYRRTPADIILWKGVADIRYPVVTCSDTTGWDT